MIGVLAPSGATTGALAAPRPPPSAWPPPPWPPLGGVGEGVAGDGGAGERRAATYQVHAVADLRRFLSGGWRVRKLGVDRAAGQRFRFQGDAEFLGCPEGLLFEERGTVTVGAHRGEGTGRYIYALQGDRMAEVRFPDQRPFHLLDLATGVARVRHDCGDDCYLGHYRVLDPDRWQVSWRVTGPRKRQLLVSRFVRAT